MRYIYLLALVLSVTALAAQQTTVSNIMHHGIEREYILYVPEMYTGEEAVPLVFNFHGLSSNAGEQMVYGDFRSIADTAGFIIVHPEGTVYRGVTHWNVGGFTIGSTVDDVGFTNAIIDQLDAEYNIDLERVYSTGMSNGGYMSFLLACQLSDRIAAVASVTGSMTPETYDECNPQHPTPIMQIHGTEDPTVPYDGAAFSRSIDDVRAYWRIFNNGAQEDILIPIPDRDMTDGTTAEHFINDGGDREVRVEHFKIIDGLHTWPGSAFRFPGTNYDVNASSEIWNFFGEFDINGKIGLPVSNQELGLQGFNVYPNPTGSILHVTIDRAPSDTYMIRSVAGEQLLTGTLSAGSTSIDMTEFISGVYILSIGDVAQKIIKE